MLVVLARAWPRKLECAGSRCWMRMKAIPVSAGSALSSWVNASSPPADAPTPTMGNDARLDGAAGWGTEGRCAVFVCREFVPFGPMGPSPPACREPGTRHFLDWPSHRKRGSIPPFGHVSLASPPAPLAENGLYPCCLVCAQATALSNPKRDVEILRERIFTGM